MIKKNFVAVFLLSGALHAVNTTKYEFSFFLGTVLPDEKTHLNTQNILGAELTFNDFGSYFTPEIQLLQSLDTKFADYPGTTAVLPDAYNGSTFVTRIALGGVHDYDIGTRWWVPFFKAHLGYETFNDFHYFDNHDSMFVAAGAGIKYYTSSRFALKLEALYLKKLNPPRSDNNVGVFFGFSYAVGSALKQTKPSE